MSTAAPNPASNPAPDTPGAAGRPRTQAVLGVDLAVTDYEQTMDWIDARAGTRDHCYVCVAATHTVVACQDDHELASAVAGASLVVPDGQPVVWAMNAFGAGLRGRVYGPELMARHMARSTTTGTRHYLYGGRNEGALVQLTLNLRRRFEGLKIVGGQSPPFRTLTDQELDTVAAEINGAAPDVVWVGIGVPKQEKWMAAMRGRLDAPVLIGVGAAFDFHAGLIPQAPRWMQKAGLEWLFRLAQEPRRLWRRYLTYNPRFVLGVARQYRQRRLTR